jgi:hypothetical protein
MVQTESLCRCGQPTRPHHRQEYVQIVPIQSHTVPLCEFLHAGCAKPGMYATEIDT